MSGYVVTWDWILRRTRRLLSHERRTWLALALGCAVLTLVAGAGLLGARAAARASGTLTDNVHVVVYVRDDMTEPRVQALEGILARLPGVATVRRVSSDEALARLQAAARELSSASEAVKAIEPGFLPRSLEVGLTPSMALGDRAQELARRLRQIEGVAEADAMTDGVVRLRAIIGAGRSVGTTMVTMAGLATIVILGLGVARARASRRSEGQVLTSLGATGVSVRFPRGLLAAMAAGLGAIAGLALLRTVFGPALRALALRLGVDGTVVVPTLSLDEALGTMLLAIVLGAVAGAVAVPMQGDARA